VDYFTCARRPRAGHARPRLRFGLTCSSWVSGSRFRFFRNPTYAESQTREAGAGQAAIVLSASDLHRAFAQPALAACSDSRSLAAIPFAAHNHRLPGASLLREGVLRMAPGDHPVKGGGDAVSRCQRESRSDRGASCRRPTTPCSGRLPGEVNGPHVRLVRSMLF